MRVRTLKWCACIPDEVRTHSVWTHYCQTWSPKTNLVSGACVDSWRQPNVRKKYSTVYRGSPIPWSVRGDTTWVLKQGRDFWSRQSLSLDNRDIISVVFSNIFAGNTHNGAIVPWNFGVVMFCVLRVSVLRQRTFTDIADSRGNCTCTQQATTGAAASYHLARVVNGIAPPEVLCRVLTPICIIPKLGTHCSDGWRS